HQQREDPEDEFPDVGPGFAVGEVGGFGFYVGVAVEDSVEGEDVEGGVEKAGGPGGPGVVEGDAEDVARVDCGEGEAVDETEGYVEDEEDVYGLIGEAEPVDDADASGVEELGDGTVEEEGGEGEFDAEGQGQDGYGVGDGFEEGGVH
ncbi:hypothetical protein HK102_012835, partial [Quaeritorhiza haematococci]